MNNFNNFVQYQTHRQLDDRYGRIIEDKYIVTPELVSRLGLGRELEGHSGCVNCLEWSENGKILASGSDDVQVVLWDPFKNKKLVTIATGHTGNIFTVKFLPNTEDRTVISGAADQSIRVHDVICNDIISICHCHKNRVKRLATDPVSPSLFWSAGEDGVVLQHDLRVPHSCHAEGRRNTSNILIDLCQFIGSKAEAKCLAINPVKTDQICVGANDPYARIYDRRMIRIGDTKWKECEDGAVQYFVPGHLPSKCTEYKRKFRSLAATYVCFSPDGRELLVNLGGEQIYLYPLIEPHQTRVCNLIVPGLKGCQNGVVKEATATSGSNGYSNGLKNGSKALSSASVDLTRGMVRFQSPKNKVCLPPAVEARKLQANKAFEEKKYAKAVHLYNECLKLCPNSAVLYGNRSAALLKRGWDGDVYAALKDCQVAFYLDPEHHKGLIRMARCLLELARYPEAAECFLIFKTRFPEHVKTDYSQGVEKDLLKFCRLSELSETDVAKMLLSSITQTACPFMRSASSGDNTEGAGSSRSRSRSCSQEEQHSDHSDDTSSDENVEMPDQDLMSGSDVRSPSSDSNSSSTTTSTQTSKTSHKHPELFDSEVVLRDKAIDFRNRFCGHCNTTTDIKEASFFGGFVVAGSDDGSFFIWDRNTTNIVKVIKGDESIVNCLQPHPSTCMLATSGIENVIRLWTPMSEEGFVNDRVVDDVNDAAYANQKRMNSNPFEVILMNMGYRITGNSVDDSEDESVSVPACNPS